MRRQTPQTIISVFHQKIMPMHTCQLILLFLTKVYDKGLTNYPNSTACHYGCLNIVIIPTILQIETKFPKTSVVGKANSASTTGTVNKYTNRQAVKKSTCCSTREKHVNQASLAQPSQSCRPSQSKSSGHTAQGASEKHTAKQETETTLNTLEKRIALGPRSHMPSGNMNLCTSTTA